MFSLGAILLSPANLPVEPDGEGCVQRALEEVLVAGHVVPFGVVGTVGGTRVVLVLGAPCAKKTCEGRGCHEIHAESVRIC